MDEIATERGVSEPFAISVRQVVELLHDQAIFVLDRRGRAASWNEGVGRILGWSEEEWIGQPLHWPSRRTTCAPA